MLSLTISRILWPGPQGFPAAKALEPVLVERIGRYRAAGGAVLFTLDTGGSSTPLPPKTLGHTLYGRVEQEKQREDLCFVKDTFGSAALLDHLRQANYPSIELAGVVSHLCVLANGILARTACPQTPIWVDPPAWRPRNGSWSRRRWTFYSKSTSAWGHRCPNYRKESVVGYGKGENWGISTNHKAMDSKKQNDLPDTGGQKTATENIP